MSRLPKGFAIIGIGSVITAIYNYLLLLISQIPKIYTMPYINFLGPFFLILGAIFLIIAFITQTVDRMKQKRQVYVEIIRALGNIGKDSDEAISALEDALLDPKRIYVLVRREAALSLGKLGTSAKTAVPSLLMALNDKDPDVRWRASEALGAIGVDTEEVTSSLNRLVHDKCDYVCESAINALDTLSEE